MAFITVRALPLIAIETFAPLKAGMAAEMAELLHQRLLRVEGAIVRLLADGWELTASGKRIIARHPLRRNMPALLAYLEENKETFGGDFCAAESYGY